jgi:hypothetical protein
MASATTPEPYQLFTTTLEDLSQASARELTSAYDHRRQIELAFDELKTY